jgi:PAS domain S-box-containing protein
MRRIAQSALNDEDVLRVRLSDREGHISVAVDRKGAKPAGDDSQVSVRRDILAPESGSVLEWDNKGARSRTLGWVEVRLSRDSETVLFVRTIGRAILAGLLALIVILCVQSAHVKRLLKPLELLSEFTKAVGRGNLAESAPVVRRDEIGELALAFNDMVRRLSETTVSRDYVDNIVQSMGDALLVTDRELRIKTVNRAAADLLGSTERDLAGRALAELADPLESFAALIGQRGQGHPQSLEGRLYARGAKPVPVLFTMSVLRNARGEGQGLVCLAQDITERRRVQEALIAAKEAAEESSRTKSNFLANMSHELRTPLNAIINYSEILIEDAEAEARRQDVADLRQIRSAGEHLLALINDVLDISKIEAGRMHVHLETAAVNEILSEVAATCGAMAQKNGTTLKMENRYCPSVRADLMKLKQILINLVGNACKFTEQGEVSLRVCGRESEAGLRVAWEVRDTGPGIAAEDLGKLFKSFTQVDGSNTRKHGGSGLGLAISQRLAGMMGGAISVASTVGSGSTFTLELPADDAAVERAAAPLAEERPTVLILDEDPRSLARCLKAWHTAGYAAQFATTADEAVRKCNLGPPFLLAIEGGTAERLRSEAVEHLLGSAGSILFYDAGANGTAPLREPHAPQFKRPDGTVMPLVSLGSESIVLELKNFAEGALETARSLASLGTSVSGPDPKQKRQEHEERMQDVTRCG